jgi:starch synthase (maltosyl-transferring)
VPVETLGIGAEEHYEVTDLLTGTTYTWRGSKNYVRLDPREKVAHVFAVKKRG